MITDINQLDFSKTYTYADYLTWQFSERVELMKGYIVKMSPAPNRKHQEISWRIALSIGNFLNTQSCKAFTAPFDVRLPLPPHRMKGDKIDTVVQPDICVICDLSKLDEQGCNGAPELVIEILSPGNNKREIKEKYQLYESAGVLEYWIVDPMWAQILKYNLNELGKFQTGRPFVEGDILTSQVLSGFELDITALFEQL